MTPRPLQTQRRIVLTPRPLQTEENNFDSPPSPNLEENNFDSPPSPISQLIYLTISGRADVSDSPFSLSLSSSSVIPPGRNTFSSTSQSRKAYCHLTNHRRQTHILSNQRRPAQSEKGCILFIQERKTSLSTDQSQRDHVTSTTFSIPEMVYTRPDASSSSQTSSCLVLQMRSNSSSAQRGWVRTIRPSSANRRPGGATSASFLFPFPVSQHPTNRSWQRS